MVGGLRICPPDVAAPATDDYDCIASVTVTSYAPGRPADFDWLAAR